jgi:tetratricopeptide (TPR) repeat protein
MRFKVLNLLLPWATPTINTKSRRELYTASGRAINGSEKIDIDSGSSGSPALNGKGEVIGIHAVKHEDYSYAIPSNALKALLAQSKPTEPLIEWRKRKHIRAYAYHVQGLVKFIAMNFREAVVNYDKAIKLNPENIYTYWHRGNAKAALGKYKKAIADYDKAIKLNPEDLLVYYLRGNVKIAFDKHEEAIADFDKIIRLNPDDADAYSNRGGIRFRLGVAEFSRGNVEKAQELYEAAIEDYTQAIKLNPEDTEVISKRGAVKSALTAMRRR